MRATLTSALALCFAWLAGCESQPDAGAAHEVASAAVQVAQPRQGSLPRTLVAWGEVSPGAAFQQAVSLPVDGALVTLQVGQGEAVKQGDVLGTFELSAAAAASSRQAETAVQVATQSLARAQRLQHDALATVEQVELAQKAVDDARTILATFPVTSGPQRRIKLKAPVTGTLASITAGPGQTVTANTPLMTMTPDSRLMFVGGVEPNVASVIRPGMAVRLQPVDGGDGVDGKVAGVGDAVDAQSRLVPLRIAVDHALMAGSAWRAEITVGQASGWIVPADAVIDSPTGTRLYQVRDGKAHAVPVNVVLERDSQMVVTGDIDASAPWVTVGVPQIAEGMALVTSGGNP